MSELKVWGIPCPSSNTELTTRPYRVWFWLYSNNQRARHRLGLHQKPTVYSIAPRCDWCGHRSAEQRAIAARNWHAMNDTTALVSDPGAPDVAQEVQR